MGRFAEWIPGNLAATVHRLLEGQMNVIEITTPATPGEALRIRHGMGRVPRGWTVIKGVAGDNTGAMDLTVDSAANGTLWTAQDMYLKFAVASRALTLAIW